MFEPAVVIPLVIEVFCGAASAIVVGNLVPPLSWGNARNAAIGAIGGLGFTWLVSRTTGIEQFVEEEGGGLSYELLVGVGVAGLIGGALLVTIAGLVRNRAR